MTHPTNQQDQLPPRIGPYQPLELIGEGGMGMVWLAEQMTPVRRRVALKLIKTGLDSKAVLARFDAERQALAMMEHSSIARIFDAGRTEDGRPYLAMEFVKGTPITNYCDENRLSLGERIRLFQQVCSGIQHAHLKGVMHRDIKPGNVLVTVQDGHPVPKLIDFGLAKAVDHRLVEHVLFTEQGQILGTPEYMSPEQAGLGYLDVDSRTDVYSLGVLLYELLTGQLPFTRSELTDQGYPEMQRILRETDPPRPSARLSRIGVTASATAKMRDSDLGALQRQLTGDLDWIVMRAIEKDRTRRYETAGELAADLQRHLDGEAVIARPPTTGYRLRKFAVRHRVAVTSGILMVAALCIGTAVAMKGWSDAEVSAEAERKSRTQLDDTARTLASTLERFTLLKGVVGLAAAERNEEQFHPPTPDRLPSMRRWVANECPPLLALRPDVDRTLAELEARGAEILPEDEYLRGALSDLTIGLRRLDKLRLDVEWRIRWAEKIEKATLAHPKAGMTWQQATEAARAGRYAKQPVDLRPMTGLVPLGLDATSGLLLFYDLRSAADPSEDVEPASVPFPRHDSEGRYLPQASDGVVFVLLPGGTFTMGADDSDLLAKEREERPRHEVRLDPFLLARTELTQAQWLRMGARSLSAFQAGRAFTSDTTPMHPAENATWSECNSLMQRAGWLLPTEAQWEYACRANQRMPWSCGATVESLAGHANVLDASSWSRAWDGTRTSFDDGHSGTSPVATYAPSPFGLYDMHGNVWEFCQDPVSGYERQARDGDGLREPSGDKPQRAVRGGSYQDGAHLARSTARSGVTIDTRAPKIGLRPAIRLPR